MKTTNHKQALLEQIKSQSKLLVSKRFIIRKSLIGQNVTVQFTDYDGKVHTYNHDKVYEFNRERFDNMKCFNKYKYYSQTFDLPKFVRDMNPSDVI